GGHRLTVRTETKRAPGIVANGSRRAESEPQLLEVEPATRTAAAATEPFLNEHHAREPGLVDGPDHPVQFVLREAVSVPGDANLVETRAFPRPEGRPVFAGQPVFNLELVERPLEVPQERLAVPIIHALEAFAM